MCDNYPKVWHTENRKARKTHRCCECGQRIVPGEVYEYSQGIWDDGPKSFKTCLQCQKVSEVFVRIDYEGCYSYGGLYEEISNGEHWNDPELRTALPHRMLLLRHNDELENMNNAGTPEELGLRDWLPDYARYGIRYKVHPDNKIYEWMHPDTGRYHGWTGA